MLKTLYKLRVSTICPGYSFSIAQEKDNAFSANTRSYRKLMNIIELKARKHGIRVYEVIEYRTSRLCAYHEVEVI